MHMSIMAKHPHSYAWDEDMVDTMSLRGTPCLKPEVIEWLNENVKDSTDKAMKHQPQGWAIGTDEYRLNGSSDLAIWFLRRRDAMKFIKHWSTFKKPTSYYNAFHYDKRKLIDGKLVKVDGDDNIIVSEEIEIIREGE